MVKHRSKKKSGSLKSQTITTIIGSVIVVILLVIGVKIGLVGWLVNLIFSVTLFFAILVNSILAYKLFNAPESFNISKNKADTSLTSKKIESTAQSELSTLDTIKHKYERLKAHYEKLEIVKNSYKEKVIQLEGELYQIREKENHKTQITTPVQKETPAPKTQETIPVKPIPPKISSLFFDGPYDDRLFSETNAASEKRFRYVYRIEFATAEPTIGKLYLEPNAAEYDILRSYSDTVLKPACAFDNAFYTSFHNISQLAPGTVQKQGNDWYVKEKVKIRFN